MKTKEKLKKLLCSWGDDDELLGIIPNILRNLRHKEQLLPTSLVDVFQAFRTTEKGSVKCVVIGEG